MNMLGCGGSGVSPREPRGAIMVDSGELLAAAVFCLAAKSKCQAAGPDTMSDISTVILLTDLTWACN